VPLMTTGTRDTTTKGGPIISGAVSMANTKRAKLFPVKLHDMLSQNDLSEGIIEWTQDGTCFYILDRDRLAAEVLPVYFDHSNYTSFSRQLNGWGFKLLKAGRGGGKDRKRGEKDDKIKACYYHEMFHRDRADDALKMKRPTSTGNEIGSSSSMGGRGGEGPQESGSDDDQSVCAGGKADTTGSTSAARGTVTALDAASGSGSIPLINRATFPVKLHAILSRTDLSDFIQWCEHGGAFRIVKPKEFASHVLPCYFDHNNLSSFLRKARCWGFRRIKKGEEAGSYFHESFRRDMPHLALRMRRQSKPGGNQDVRNFQSSAAIIAAHRSSYSGGAAPSRKGEVEDDVGCSSSSLLGSSSDSTDAENETVMKSPVNWQEVLNEQQELLRGQILEVTNAEAQSQAPCADGAARDHTGSSMPNGGVFITVDEGDLTSPHQSNRSGLESDVSHYAVELAQLQEELTKVPVDTKPALSEALIRCPDIVNNETTRLLFLWCTDFDAVAAAQRMVRYWQLRVEIFGNDRAFLPLDSEAILDEDDRNQLFTGAIRILPHTDAFGRTIFYVDQQKLHARSFDARSAVRTMWYQYHTILSDPDRARRGIVGISNYQNSSWLPNYAWMTLISNTFKYSPIEVKAAHLCHAGIFCRIFSQLCSWVIGPWVRNRSFAFHSHDGAEVIASLTRFGIPAESVPAELK